MRTALAFALLVALVACNGLGQSGAPLLLEARVDIVNPGSAALLRTDFDSLIVRADGEVVIRITEKDIRPPATAPVSILLYEIPAGFVGLIDLAREYRETLAADEPLPDWVLESGLFPGGVAEIALLGFTPPAVPSP